MICSRATFDIRHEGIPYRVVFSFSSQSGKVYRAIGGEYVASEDQLLLTQQYTGNSKNIPASRAVAQQLVTEAAKLNTEARVPR